MSDMTLFCYSCSALGSIIKCCPDAPGSVALVPVGWANGVARQTGNLRASVAELEAELAKQAVPEDFVVVPKWLTERMQLILSLYSTDPEGVWEDLLSAAQEDKP